MARTEEGKRVIRRGAFVLRENDDLFVPALWQAKEIIAYSRTGYEKKTWRLPADWRDITSFDLYRITLQGPVPARKQVPAIEGRLVLSLAAGEAIAIVPAGMDPADVWAAAEMVFLARQP